MLDGYLVERQGGIRLGQVVIDVDVVKRLRLPVEHETIAVDRDGLVTVYGQSARQGDGAAGWGDIDRQRVARCRQIEVVLQLGLGWTGRLGDGVGTLDQLVGADVALRPLRPRHPALVGLAAGGALAVFVQRDVINGETGRSQRLGLGRPAVVGQRLQVEVAGTDVVLRGRGRAEVTGVVGREVVAV